MTEDAKSAWMPPPTQPELISEIERTRAELASTIDELVTRLDPRIQAANVAQQTKVAATDAGVFLTGGGLPEEDPKRTRNVKLLVSVASAAVVGTALMVTVMVRRRLRNR